MNSILGTWRIKAEQLAVILAIVLVAVIPITNSLTTISSLALFLVSLLYINKATWQKIIRNPTVIAISLYLSLLLIDSFFSIGNAKEISLSIRKSIRLLYFLVLLPVFMKENHRVYAYMAYIAAVFVSVVASIIYTWSFFKDPIFTSLFVVFAIFMLAHLSIENKKYSPVFISLAGFFTYYLFFKATGRCGQLLFFILTPLFIWQRFTISKRFIRWGTLALVLGCTLFYFVPTSFVERQSLAINEIKQYLNNTAVNPHESSLGIRFTFVQNSWQVIKEKPILGYGSGSFPRAYANKIPITNPNIIGVNPHNQYLLTWVELGLPGLFLLLAIFGTLVLTFYKQQSLTDYLGLGLLICMIIGCTMNSWLLDYTSCIFFVVMSALCASTKLNKEGTVNSSYKSFASL